MGSETLGLDFDGVLRKWPGFIGWYANFLRPDDILIRARLFFLRRLFNYVFMSCTPIIIDGMLIDSLNHQRPKRLILVSGRYLDRQKEEVYRKLSPYLHFDTFYFRDNCKESEERFKERVLIRENVDFYLEDRNYVVNYLHSKGVNAISIKEIRK